MAYRLGYEADHRYHDLTGRERVSSESTQEVKLKSDLSYATLHIVYY